MATENPKTAENPKDVSTARDRAKAHLLDLLDDPDVKEAICKIVANDLARVVQEVNGVVGRAFIRRGDVRPEALRYGAG